MQRLSGLDASFLYLETSSQPMHVCSIIELDTSTVPGGYTFERLRDALVRRIRAIPPFREKLADGPLNLDHPVWVDDEDFDVDRHLHRIAVPAPGGRAELSQICGHIAQTPLDRRRPLWEMWVIEGVAGTDCHRDGRLAVMTKVHHAGVDGVTGANLMSQLCATEPDAAAPEPAAGVGGGAGWRIAAGGLVRFAARPLRLASVVPETAASVLATVRRALDGAAMARPFAAPATVFNARISNRRCIAYAELNLDDVKAVKNHFGVKVNDVVMALVSGVLRQYLAERNALPDSSLVASVPISVHGKSDRPGRNQVSAMFASLHTEIADPVQRLKAIAHANSIAKEHSSAIGASLLQDWTQFAAPAVFGIAMRLYARTRFTDSMPVHNLVVSNVPGPQVPLYLLGCEVKAMYPLGPIFHGSGLNITAMSLRGKLDVGLIGCPDLVPDLWELADEFAVAMEELRAAAR
ncbi:MULTISPECIES: WS/DGAT/MGAT family O-acyltransferase [Mycobacterium avium complex (MAC)]|uniref:Diacylglycerol O-acyltransferase n=2 Tax=Mycobacterium avium complex (MAC) TaxID=120793 RepID=A0ABX3TGT3_9MYCO|nr:MULTISPECIES: wax ester/triacylglycerol synthase family O-acyltransferase [Mycobacterium avium complex (MAC)]ETZ42777.1 acyltransferase, WS/DGAT/MGAT family protein [Mycobacterium avium MAV_061107_1842]MBZ4551329.1 wax ester/triacylglycerol synthase family O-acyltransferase [Mycobacterium avium subsp. hominissuis]MDV3249371.1 wax ester/triacylglycerol synthase family O-acyltransferase [Mycobacterium avium subsp. hominissuis]MDV3276392.1 wax ester/triacylglycerol synthase family O-acyltransfe